MPLSILYSDITEMQVDAIVNAANTSLRMGGGVCGAIFRAAGAAELAAACAPLSPIATGQAVITPGFALPAKHVIHTPGPVYRGGDKGEETLLRACYQNALLLASENDCSSIAFPLISSGIFGYPKAEALAIAVDSILSFPDEQAMQVSLVLFPGAFSLSSQGKG